VRDDDDDDGPRKDSQWDMDCFFLVLEQNHKYATSIVQLAGQMVAFKIKQCSHQKQLTLMSVRKMQLKSGFAKSFTLVQADVVFFSGKNQLKCILSEVVSLHL
jgi:hypothetical protein